MVSLDPGVVPQAPPPAPGAPAAEAWSSAGGPTMDEPRLELDELSTGRSRAGLVVFVVLLIAAGAVGAWLLLGSERSDRRRGSEAAQTGSILVRSDPDGATIKVDGRDSGKRTPARIDGLSLDAPHRIDLTLAGRIPWTEEVTALAEGRSVHAMLAPDTPEYRSTEQPSGEEPDAAATPQPSDLRHQAPSSSGVESAPAAPPVRRVAADGEGGSAAQAPSDTGGQVAGDAEHSEAAATDTGFLTVRTDVRALVTFDGRPLGRAPLYKVRVPAGTHQVRVQFDGAESTSWRDARVQIRPGWEFTLSVTMDE